MYFGLLQRGTIIYKSQRTIISLFLLGSLGGKDFKGGRVDSFLETSETVAKVSNFPEN